MTTQPEVTEWTKNRSVQFSVSDTEAICQVSGLVTVINPADGLMEGRLNTLTRNESPVRYVRGRMQSDLGVYSQSYLPCHGKHSGGIEQVYLPGQDLLYRHLSARQFLETRTSLTRSQPL